MSSISGGSAKSMVDLPTLGYNAVHRCCSNINIMPPLPVGRERHAGEEIVLANFTPISAAIGGALIGLSAALLMLLTGRVAGIGGIFGGLLSLETRDKTWRLAF